LATVHVRAYERIDAERREPDRDEHHPERAVEVVEETAERVVEARRLVRVVLYPAPRGAMRARG
jgi:hypothetical protein